MSSGAFPELRGLSADQMLFVKEDLILPPMLTFFELIASKARGKSGPLFDFEARDDVRLVSDARVEVETSHAGKVMTRSFYNANKHNFPCSRFEEFESFVAAGGQNRQYTIVS